MSFVGLAITAVGVGASIYSIASAPGAPQQPNLAASSQALSDAQASMLPVERGLANAAQAGSSFTFTPPPGFDMSELKTGGQAKQNKDGSYTVDFTGQGSGTTQGIIAGQQAADQLKQAQQFDPAFIASAVQQEQLANPQGAQARALENSLIQQQISNPTENPVADTLDSQIGARVSAGKNLDPFETGALNQATAAALSARGGSSGAPADFSAPLTTGLAGNQRQQQGIAMGQDWLGSGETPEDVQYRKEQQNLSNLSSEVNGATPESQFKSLDNASSGPTPVNNGAPLPTMPGGQVGTAGSAALSSYGTQLNNQEQQTNPWMAGISTVLNAGGALGQLGYKPLSTGSPLPAG